MLSGEIARLLNLTARETKQILRSMHGMGIVESDMKGGGYRPDATKPEGDCLTSWIPVTAATLPVLAPLSSACLPCPVALRG